MPGAFMHQAYREFVERKGFFEIPHGGHFSGFQDGKLV
jgi:hypothetical protein